MNFRPLTVARLGIYAAIAVAVLSAWLGINAGASLEFVLVRAAIVFIIFAALGFGAEAVLTVDFRPGEHGEDRYPGASARDEQA